MERTLGFLEIISTVALIAVLGPEVAGKLTTLEALVAATATTALLIDGAIRVV